MRRALASSRQRVSVAVRSGIVAVAVGNAGVLALGLGASVVAARALGPAARGEYFGSSSIALLVSMALGLGVVQAIVTFSGRQVPYALLVVQAAAAGVVCAGLVAVLAVAGVQPWLDASGVLGCSLLCVGTLLSSFSASMAQRDGDMRRRYQTVRLSPQAASVGCMIVLALGALGGSNRWLLVTGAATVVVAAMQFVSARRRSEHAEPDTALSRDQGAAPSFIRESLSTTPAMMATLALNRVDVALVAVLLAPTQIAMYAIAVAALGACTALGNAVGMVTFSRLSATGVGPGARPYVATCLVRAVVGSALASLGVVVLAPVLIDAFYGRDFSDAIGPTRLLALAAIPSSACFLLFHVMLLLDLRKAVTFSYVVASTLIGAGTVVAAARDNVLFVAAAVVCSYTVLAVLLWRLVDSTLSAGSRRATPGSGVPGPRTDAAPADQPALPGASTSRAKIDPT
jgi:O-antigen/teichoic acid export membrane protein